MNLFSISRDEKIVIDANIFIYANQLVSNQCVKLLERCAKDEIQGIITTNILAEVMHVLMLAEARDINLIKGSNPAKQLAKNPNKIKALHRYEQLIRDLLTIGLQLELLQREDFITAMSLQHQYGLLTNDALFLAVATRLRITNIVSADEQFNLIHGIKLFSPDDLKLE